MLRRLSQIYDVEFSENRGKALIAALAGSMIPATSGIGAASTLKFVPVVGTLAAAFVMPILSAGANRHFHSAFRIGRHAARLQSAGLSRIREIPKGKVGVTEQKVRRRDDEILARRRHQQGLPVKR